MTELVSWFLAVSVGVGEECVMVCALLLFRGVTAVLVA